MLCSLPFPPQVCRLRISVVLSFAFNDGCCACKHVACLPACLAAFFPVGLKPARAAPVYPAPVPTRPQPTSAPGAVDPAYLVFANRIAVRRPGGQQDLRRSVQQGKGAARARAGLTHAIVRPAMSLHLHNGASASRQSRQAAQDGTRPDKTSKARVSPFLADGCTVAAHDRRGRPTALLRNPGLPISERRDGPKRSSRTLTMKTTTTVTSR